MNWSVKNRPEAKDGVTYIPNSFDAEVWFRVTGSGSHSIKLSRFVPEFYNQLEHQESMEIFLYDANVGTPSAINYSTCDDGCFYLAHASTVPEAQYYEWSYTSNFSTSYITSSSIFPDATCEEGFHEGLQNVDLYCRAWNECGHGATISELDHDMPDHVPPCEARIDYTVENNTLYYIDYVSGVPSINFTAEVDCKEISIFNLQGQILQTVYSFAGNKFSIILNLPVGIYFIKMQLNNSNYSDKIIILN